MERQIQLTADGSHTIAISGMDITYHSKHGAIQESEHVFIAAGWQYCIDQQVAASGAPLYILEMGLGTGLNAILTARASLQQNISVVYHSLEQFPLQPTELANLNLGEQVGEPELFQALHTVPWNELLPLHDYFHIHKHHTSLQDFKSSELFHCIYFDAFAPNAQPELWTASVFEQLFQLLHHNGILVTYCSKGYVRRNMQAAGFTVTKIPGPPGKREMVRAIKPAASLT